MSADIILYALVAAGLVFWLRNILGTRHEDEPQRPNPFVSNAAKKQATSQDAAQNGIIAGLNGDEPEDIKAGLDRSMGYSDAVAPILIDIARIDRSFGVSRFLRAAQDAFVLVVESFAEGDKEMLEELLSPSVYKAFAGVIDQRAQDGEKASVEIHSVRKSEIIEASLKGKTAIITVRFVADETNILRDKKGKVLAGDPDRVTETIDIWTFTRDLKSRNPAWLVTATRDEDAQESDHKTVPDGDEK